MIRVLILCFVFLLGCQKEPNLLAPVFSPSCGMSANSLYGQEKIRGVDASGYKVSNGDTTIHYFVNRDSSLITGQSWSFVIESDRIHKMRDVFNNYDLSSVNYALDFEFIPDSTYGELFYQATTHRYFNINFLSLDSSKTQISVLYSFPIECATCCNSL